MIAWTIAAVIGIWLLAAVGVRIALDWSDTMPYTPESEVRYLVIAGLALAVGFGGSTVAVLVARARWRRPPR